MTHKPKRSLAWMLPMAALLWTNANPNRVGGGSDGAPVLEITLLSGELSRGRLLLWNDDVVVIDVDGLPYGVAFAQMQPTGSLRLMRKMLLSQRDDRMLKASDHLKLAQLALMHDRYEIARHSFGLAVGADSTLKEARDESWRSHRMLKKSVFAFTSSIPTILAPTGDGQWEGADEDAGGSFSESFRQITDGYRSVGERLRGRLGSDLRLVETDHFLIWTDWSTSEHDVLRRSCEHTYSVLAQFFGNNPAKINVFAGKCPIFCLRNKKRFLQAAKLLDDHDGSESLGYTSTQSNGHVHVVLRRQGGSIAGRLSFAGTLAHEGTHAFMHRYRTPRRLPSWIHEGLAQYVAQIVVGDACSYAKLAAAVAHVAVRDGYPLPDRLFADNGHVQPADYAFAHSLVSFLIERDAQGFATLIRDIKDGIDTETALKTHFDFTFTELESLWRRAHEDWPALSHRNGNGS